MGFVLDERLQFLEDKLFCVEVDIENTELYLEHQKKVAEAYRKKIEEIINLIDNAEYN